MTSQFQVYTKMIHVNGLYADVLRAKAPVAFRQRGGGGGRGQPRGLDERVSPYRSREESRGERVSGAGGIAEAKVGDWARIAAEDSFGARDEEPLAAESDDRRFRADLAEELDRFPPRGVGRELTAEELFRLGPIRLRETRSGSETAAQGLAGSVENRTPSPLPRASDHRGIDAGRKTRRETPHERHCARLLEEGFERREQAGRVLDLGARLVHHGRSSLPVEHDRAGAAFAGKRDQLESDSLSFEPFADRLSCASPGEPDDERRILGKPERAQRPQGPREVDPFSSGLPPHSPRAMNLSRLESLDLESHVDREVRRDDEDHALGSVRTNVEPGLGSTVVLTLPRA